MLSNELCVRLNFQLFDFSKSASQNLGGGSPVGFDLEFVGGLDG